MRRVGKEPDYPETEGVEILIDVLAGMGFAAPGGFGIVPFLPVDVDAYLRRSAWDLDPGDFELVLAASRAYAGGHAEFSDERKPAPFGNVPEDQPSVSDQIRAGFEALMKDQGKKKRRGR